MEGLLPRHVLTAPRNLPVAERVDDCVGDVDLDATHLRSSARVNQGDHPVIPHVDQLDRLGLVVVKGVDPILHVGAQGVLAMDRPTIVDGAFSGAVVDVIGPVVVNPVDSVASVGIDCGPNQLHVLLRHRLLPSPAAWRASSRVMYSRPLATFPSRSV